MGIILFASFLGGFFLGGIITYRICVKEIEKFKKYLKEKIDLLNGIGNN